MGSHSVYMGPNERPKNAREDTTGVFSNGPLLKKPFSSVGGLATTSRIAMVAKRRMNQNEITTFTISSKCLRL